jgi:hypothetical protein
MALSAIAIDVNFDINIPLACFQTAGRDGE